MGENFTSMGHEQPQQVIFRLPKGQAIQTWFEAARMVGVLCQAVRRLHPRRYAFDNTMGVQYH